MLQGFESFIVKFIPDQEVRMAGSHHISRREFITLTTAAVGTVIGAVIGLPAIAYQASFVDPSTSQVINELTQDQHHRCLDSAG